MNKLFQKVGGLKPGKSVFNLSYEYKTTCDMGQLIPVMVTPVIPGDIFKMAIEAVIRMQPLVAPVMHSINVSFHSFFVANRLLWTPEMTADPEDCWEAFITGGADGSLAPSIPTWQPAAGKRGVGSLWDYMGFPVTIDPQGFYPVDFPKRAYNLIYNEYYRDPTYITEIDIETSEDVLIRAWEKDYFTSALPWQQRGTAPALPVSGTLQAVWAGNITNQTLTWPAVDGSGGSGTAIYKTGTTNPYDSATKNFLEAGKATIAKTSLDANTIDASSLTTFDISDLRSAFAVQKYLERNARAGSRYTEYLRAHFGVSPTDERLSRPEYIGGAKLPLIMSEVLQTSATGVTGTPQGNMAGKGITVGGNYLGKYRVEEFGVIMTIMSIMPKAVYQQGIDKKWRATTRLDYPSPEFMHLSEQAISKGEIYASAVSGDNNALFGYQGIFDELRQSRSLVTGEMATTFDYWHLSRQFGSLPSLNQTFIECVPRKDIFAAPTVPGFIVNIGNILTAIRPMPAIAEPGLIDHS